MIIAKLTARIRHLPAFLAVLAVATGISSAHATLADSAGPPDSNDCASHEGMQRLDFWRGEWNVFVTDDTGKEVLAGTNRIEKILAGCAVAEYWQSSRGGEGRSLFYFHPQEDRWKQVWVTARALAVGGLKEKAEQPEFAGPGIRFQGRVSLPSGSSVLDRTTLTPLDDGSVRQHIEYSSDDGATWQTTFDAIYRRR